MKKILTVLCALTVAAALFTGCSKGGAGKGPVTINLWSFTDEIPGMVEKYIADHPDCGFTVKQDYHRYNRRCLSASSRPGSYGRWCRCS
jgi:ABC-type glycerol-3-phosphate transport system substrate-binding protein